MSTTACPVPPNCSESSRVCPSACQAGYECTLSVIDSLCKCPIASCKKVSFDIGDGDSNDDNSESKGSVVGPILGGLAGVVLLLSIIIVVLRRRRRKQLQYHRDAMMSNPDDDNIEFHSKRWTRTPGDRSSQRDVIQIAYIPSMISENSHISDHQGTRSPFVISLMEESHNKHDSVASNMSSVLDEAVVMGVTTKATPQVMKLQTIKQTNTELISRSNSLHTSNSIKRTNSQRHLASVKLNSNGGYSRNRRQQNPSPLGGDKGTLSDDEHEDQDASKGGQRPLSNLSDNNPFMSSEEKEEPSQTGSSKSLASNNPFMSSQELSGASSSSSTTAYSSALSSTLHSLEPFSPFDPDTHSTRLTPWANNGLSRDSTFSTASDAQSSTRGDGEEIMIFWGGHSNRNSKASDL
ncbi:hypothetical protein BGZ94_007314 [Podila epigama]|nr:hypothetical protein BGZ94_007314 [Podila epigama]